MVLCCHNYNGNCYKDYLIFLDDDISVLLDCLGVIAFGSFMFILLSLFVFICRFWWFSFLVLFDGVFLFKMFSCKWSWDPWEYIFISKFVLWWSSSIFFGILFMWFFCSYRIGRSFCSLSNWSYSCSTISKLLFDLILTLLRSVLIDHHLIIIMFPQLAQTRRPFS